MASNRQGIAAITSIAFIWLSRFQVTNRPRKKTERRGRGEQETKLYWFEPRVKTNLADFRMQCS